MPRDASLRIGIIGCSGLGKSSVARALSEKLDIPCLSSKEITRPLLKRFGYQYSEDCFVESFLSEKEIEFELVDRRMETETRLRDGGFVTDRTTLECFCYAFLSLHTYSEDEFSLLEMICRTNMQNYTHLFQIPINSGWLEENGIRTMNAHLQRHIDILLRGMIGEWRLNVVAVPFDTALAGKSADFIAQAIR